MNKTLLLSIAASSTLLVHAMTSADEIKGRDVCEKMKTCVVETMVANDTPKATLDMIVSQLENQCLSSYEEKDKLIADAGLKKQANACAKDMIEMPCEELMTVGQSNSIESCQAFEEASKKAGIQEQLEQ